MMGTGAGQWVWAWVPSSLPPFPPTMPMGPQLDQVDPAAAAIAKAPVTAQFEEIVIDEPTELIPKDEKHTAEPKSAEEKAIAGHIQDVFQDKNEIKEKVPVVVGPPLKKSRGCPPEYAPTAKRRATAARPPPIPPPQHLFMEEPAVIHKSANPPCGWESTTWGNNQWHSRQWSDKEWRSDASSARGSDWHWNDGA